MDGSPGGNGYGTFGTGRWARGGGEGSVRNAPPAVVLGRAPLGDPAEWVAEGAPEAGTTGVDVDAAPRSAPPALVWPKRQSCGSGRARETGVWREAKTCECCDDDAKPYGPDPRSRPPVRRGGGPRACRRRGGRRARCGR
ncbi:hypothetical protein PZ61_0215350 [Streptomyces sp. MNU77]|nr:hypothetical protein PZ61_0215350 [Streptomyces sp. MNU77]OWA23353.1 hypothetical protein B9W61_16000 [Streptomyces sp. CS057]